MGTKSLVISLMLFSFLLTNCAADTPKLAPSDVSPGLAFPSQPVPPPRPTSAFEATATPDVPPPSTVPSTTTISTSPSPGWTEYVSINDIYDLAFAPDDTLWAITNGGLVHWDLNTDTYTRHLIHARNIAVAPDETLWLATDYGVCHFDGAICKNYSTADGLIHNSVRVVAAASDRVVWVGTEKGINRFDGESWHSYPSDVPITDLTVDANGEVWVATSLGVGRYLPAQNGWTTYTTEHGLPEAMVRTVFKHVE
ncbi:MAG: hypothetical protein GY832_12160 [Chloroflexi bacterium]|nr:hypothetical protein [Chloroflexota bacterium]